jgi:hypothetical protein
MGFCIIKYSEGYMSFPIYGGTSIPSFPTLRSLSRSSCPYSLRILDTRSQECYRAAVFVPCVCLGTRNVSFHLKLSAVSV